MTNQMGLVSMDELVGRQWLRNGNGWSARPASRAMPSTISGATTKRSFSDGRRGRVKELVQRAVEEIIERSGTPYFCFKDVDENEPDESIKMETIAYYGGC